MVPGSSELESYKIIFGVGGRRNTIGNFFLNRNHLVPFGEGNISKKTLPVTAGILIEDIEQANKRTDDVARCFVIIRAECFARLFQNGFQGIIRHNIFFFVTKGMDVTNVAKQHKQIFGTQIL